MPLGLASIPSFKPLPVYDGIVAGGGLWQTITVGLKESIHRKCFVVAQEVRVARFLYANVQLIEATVPGTRTIKAGVENADGTFTQVTFNGGAGSATLSGGDYIWSDPVQIIWNPFRRSYVRTWTNSSNGATAGILFHGSYDRTTLGEWSDYNAADGTIPDITLGGSPAVQHNLTFGPIAVRALTSLPSALQIGDSRDRGSNSTGFSPVFNSDGEMDPALREAFIPTVNCGLGGEGTYLWANGTSSTVIRKMLAGFCTEYTVDIGINDFNNGQTSAQVRTNLVTMYNSMTFATPSGKPRSYGVCTVSPFTTSTDFWATQGNQTVFSGDSERQAFHSALRGSGIELNPYVIDVASVTENGTSGKWVTNGAANYIVRVDGLHPNTVGCGLIRDSGIMPVGRFKP